MLAIADLRTGFADVAAAGDAASVARGALAIARIGHPALTPAAALGTLDALAAGIQARLDPHLAVEHRAAALATYLFEECGFRGNRDDYYDPRNSFLNDVLERRTGIPITLAIVMLEVGARVGIPLVGVGFPGHFLVRVVGTAEPHLLDPFFGGRVIGYDELKERLRAFYAASGAPAGTNLQRALPQALQTTGALGILARVLGNLLAIYREREDHLRALASIELMLVLNPDAAEHYRVRGLLHEQLECFASAAEDFRRYLALAPRTPAAADVRARLERLSPIAGSLH